MRFASPKLIEGWHTYAQGPKADADEAPDHQGKGAPAHRRGVELCEGPKEDDGRGIIEHTLTKDQIVEEGRDLQLREDRESGHRIGG